MIALWATVAIVYILGAVATAGYYERRRLWDTFYEWPYRLFDADNWFPAGVPVPSPSAGTVFWPVRWAGWLVWCLFGKPVMRVVRPIIFRVLWPGLRGVYRLGAGMTFLPPSEDR